MRIHKSHAVVNPKIIPFAYKSAFSEWPINIAFPPDVFKSFRKLRTLKAKDFSSACCHLTEKRWISQKLCVTNLFWYFLGEKDAPVLSALWRLIMTTGIKQKTWPRYYIDWGRAYLLNDSVIAGISYTQWFIVTEMCILNTFFKGAARLLLKKTVVRTCGKSYSF